MKAVILCAGKGTRLRPFSYTIPKHLLPVCNKPVLRYLLDEMKEIGEIQDIAIIVSEETKIPIQEYITAKCQDLPFQFTFLLQEYPLGLAHACSMADSFVGLDDFLLLLGDNIIPGGIRAMFEQQQDPIDLEDATILVRKVPDPRPYGVVEFDKAGRVISMEEKPTDPKSDYVIVGIYRFKPIIFNAIKEIKPSKRGEYEITDAIFNLKNKTGSVKVKVFNGDFLDIGKPDSLLEANLYIMNHGKNHLEPIDPTSQISNSQIESNVSIGSNCVIQDSILRHCIVLENTTIRGANLINSIIGRNCNIQFKNQDKNPIKIIVSDDSKIEKD